MVVSPTQVMALVPSLAPVFAPPRRLAPPEDWLENSSATDTEAVALVLGLVAVSLSLLGAARGKDDVGSHASQHRAVTASHG